MRIAFAVIFAASGAAALIYEVTWTRLLTLQLGHGVAAASTVLAAFMGGLALGSAAGGRLGGRLQPAQALRIYAGLVVSIAVLALVLPFELGALDPLLAAAYADGSGGTSYAFLRFVTSLLLLTIPAAAMGATFPVASRWFVQHAGQAARDAGALYAANTFGAAFGALLAGFILLPFMGLVGATWIAVGLNLLAAGGAWVISRQPALSESRNARVEGASVVSGQLAPSESRNSQVEGSSAIPTSAKGANRTRRRKAPSPASRAAASPTRAEGPSPWLAAIALGISGFASLT